MAARVGMLALFQNKVGYSHGQIATSLMPRPLTHVNQTRLQHCLLHESITLKAVITKHSTGVKVKHMTHKASPVTIAKKRTRVMTNHTTKKTLHQ